MAQEEVLAIYNGFSDHTRIHDALRQAWRRGANSLAKEVHWTFLKGIAMSPWHPAQRELRGSVHGT
eukprot:1580525-Heterocapsa_arctica.AAC.1